MIAPLDDDYDAMRREIWLTTDTAYKRAITMFARKKAAFQNRTASDPIPDFSKEPPVETIAAAAGRRPDASAAPAEPLARVQQASAVFAAHPDVDLSEVAITQVHGTRYYLNSEGFKTVAPIQIAALTMYARSAGRRRHARAADVQRRRDARSPICRRRPISSRARAALSTEVVAARAARRSAKSSPVRCCIEGIGSAQFVAETLVQMMQARRPPDAENPRMAQAPPSPFLNRTGLRVMADAFIARDTPSLTQFEGRAARRQLRRRRRRRAREGRDARGEGTPR